MTTPSSFLPRPSTGRSSFAVAMKDYTLIRPGIAVTISAVTLTLSLVIGLWLIFSLSEAADTVNIGPPGTNPEDEERPEPEGTSGSQNQKTGPDGKPIVPPSRGTTH